MRSSKFFAVLAAVALCSCSGGPADLDSALKVGYAALEKQDYVRAGKLAAAALKFKDNDVSALLLKSLAAEGRGDRALALDAARQATKADPTSFAAFYTLGRLYALDDKSLSEAQGALRRALELKADDRNAMVLLAGLYLHSRSGPRAVECLERLSALEPEEADSSAFLNSYAVGCFYAGRVDAGSSALAKAWKKDKTDPDTAFNIAVYHEKYRNPPNYRAARQAYNKFLSLARGKPEYASRSAEVEKHLRDLSAK